MLPGSSWETLEMLPVHDFKDIENAKKKKELPCTQFMQEVKLQTVKIN